MSEVIDLKEGVDYKVVRRREVKPAHQRRRIQRKPITSGVRVDLLLESVASRLIPPAIWNAGAGDLARDLIRESVPTRPMTVASLAREIGLLPRRRHARA